MITLPDWKLQLQPAAGWDSQSKWKPKQKPERGQKWRAEPQLYVIIIKDLLPQVHISCEDIKDGCVVL